MEIEAITKTCSRCKETKLGSDFYKSSSSPDGKHHYCKQCCTEYKREEYQSWSKERRQKFNTKTPEKRRQYSLKQLYGITVEEYKEMHVKQGGVCAICSGTNKSGKPLFVDHCHESGKVWGLLCMHCNHALGKFNDDIETLLNAIAYLEAYNE